MPSFSLRLLKAQKCFGGAQWGELDVVLCAGLIINGRASGNEWPAMDACVTVRSECAYWGVCEMYMSVHQLKHWFKSLSQMHLGHNKRHKQLTGKGLRILALYYSSSACVMWSLISLMHISISCPSMLEQCFMASQICTGWWLGRYALHTVHSTTLSKVASRLCMKSGSSYCTEYDD